MNTRNGITTPVSIKRIVLCSDDYAQSASISAGILQLVEHHRLSAVSCFSEGDFWSHGDNILCAYRERIDIGLHFNLTHPFPASSLPAQPLNRVMRLALSGRIDRAEIARTLHRQLDRFESVAKQMPDFLDGHQHVHMFPAIRSIVIGELAQRYGQKKPYLRAVNPRVSIRGDFIKTLILKFLGTGFSDLAQRHGMRTNRGFGGIYALQPQTDFAALMHHWLATANHGDLFMCHPGEKSGDNSDPIAATRPVELAFLMSDEFETLLSRHAICLSRLADIEHRTLPR